MIPSRLVLILLIPIFNLESTSAAPTGAPSDAEVSRLVRQLGSPNFAEREAATKALRALGEKALASLRAAKGSPDAEVRRRATSLLRPLEAKVRMKEIGYITASGLTPREKGLRLMKYITKGLTEAEVEGLLGEGRRLRTQIGNGESYHVLVFTHFGLRVRFRSRPAEGAGFRVVSVETEQ